MLGKRSSDEGTGETSLRLQKVIARAGLASRRAADELIAAGRVSINGSVIRELGVKVTSRDQIAVDGRPLSNAAVPIYILLYKPTGVVTTVRDPYERRTVIDCLTTVSERVFPVGRLDYDTSGALLLTNDGELAHRLMHPKFAVNKTYEAVVSGRISSEALSQLERGVSLDGRLTARASAECKGTDGRSSRIVITIHEGRNRQVRRMFEAVGYPCQRLVRTQYASLSLRGLKPGQWRHLTEQEVHQLRTMV